MEISTLKRKALSTSRLREVLKYDATLGTFTWRCDLGRARCGSSAGNPHAKGYHEINIDSYSYLRHHLVWLYVHGKWPSGQLDHRDGDRGNDRVENLRLATQVQNSANSRRSVANKSGYKGVHFVRAKQKWRAALTSNYRTTHLGYFDDPKAAAVVYQAAALKLNGEFARFA